MIADPDWDRQRFEVIRQWCLEIPEIVTISVNTPYPGTETWLTEPRKIQSRDYRLFDIQHAVLPTTLPLPEFYEELVKTQQVLNMKHLGWRALRSTAKIAAGHLWRGQTNFVRMLWKFNSVYNPALQLADHQKSVPYEMTLLHPLNSVSAMFALFQSKGRQERHRRLHGAVRGSHENGDLPVKIYMLGQLESSDLHCARVTGFLPDAIPCTVWNVLCQQEDEQLS